jgi:hypothetical protein
MSVSISRIANANGCFMFFNVPMFQLIISKQLLRVGGSLRAIVVVVLAQKWIDLISRHISVAVLLLLLNQQLLLLIEYLLLLLHYMLLYFMLR